MNINELNISLRQFEEISNGQINGGQIDLKIKSNGSGKLVKINHHATFTGSNNKSISNDKVVAIKEAFVKALRDNGAPEELINDIRNDVGLNYEVHEGGQHNADFIGRRFTPMTRQQVKEYLDRYYHRAPQNNDVNQQVRQRIQDSIRAQAPDNTKIIRDMSILAGTSLTEIINPQADQDTLLKALKTFPRIMGAVHSAVSSLSNMHFHPNAENNQTVTLMSGGKLSATIRFSTVNDEQGQPVLQAEYKSVKDASPIQINFGVSPQQYLNALNENLMNFVDIAPDVKDEFGVSIGCKHLTHILDKLKKKASDDEYLGNMQSPLRDLSLAVIRKFNPEIPDETLNLFSTSVIVASARLKLNQPSFDIKGFFDAKIAEANALAAQLEEANNPQEVENNVEAVNQLNQNNVNNQENPAVNNNQQENEGQPVHVNGPVGEVPEALDPVVQQQELIAEIMEVPLPPDPANIPYVPMVSTDPKDMTSVINQIAGSLDEATNKVDFAALKNILANNADLILGFLSGHVVFGSYKNVNAENQTDIVYPFFNKNQTTVILKTLLDAFKQDTGKELDLTAFKLGQVDEFKQFLENKITEQKLAATISEALKFTTLNNLYSSVKKGEVLPAATPVKDNAGFQTISLDSSAEPFRGYVSEQELNVFLSGLTSLGKGNDQNAVKAYILENSSAFLTFLSGKYADSLAIDMIYREDFEEIRPAICKLLANTTGIYEFSKSKPEITKLTGFELKKVLKALEHPSNVNNISVLVNPVPESLKAFHAQFDSGVDVAERKTREFEPSNLQNVDTKAKASAKDDSGIVIKPLNVLSTTKMGALPAIRFINAEQDSVRNVASTLMSITKSGTAQEQQDKILSLVADNLKSLIYAVNDKSYLEKCLAPQMKSMVDDIHAILRTTLEGILKGIPNRSFNVDYLSANDYTVMRTFFKRANPFVAGKVKNPLTQAEKTSINKAVADTLKAIDGKLPAVVNKAKVEFQSFINQVFNIDPNAKVPHPYLKMTPEQIENNLKNKNVDQILEEARFDMNRPGMLAFHLTVIKDYFLKLPNDEIAKIFTSALKAAPADTGKNEFLIDGNKRLLEALFKGAGPLFQKMIQGLDKRLADKSYGDVFDSMKSNLPSIDKHEAQKIIDREIAELKKKNPKNAELQSCDLLLSESMGAATVGETFKCTLVYDAPQGKGKPPKQVVEVVVVKVMRPDIEKRVLNEKAIFDDAAKKIPGVEASWNSQIASILTEFNYENEAKNIDKGKEIYQVEGVKKSKDHELAPNVNSMERNTVVPPSKNILVMNLADGEPFDKYFNELKNKIFFNFSSVFKTNPETGEWITDEKGYPELKDNIDPESIIRARMKSLALISDLFEMNYMLRQISGKWIKDALFNSGVFHNDMHGGNMMIDIEEDHSKITVIDYGNLMSLSSDERKMVKNLLVFTSLRKATDFVNVLTKLMHPAPNKEEDLKLRAIVKTIMEKGKGIKDTGYRFTCILEEIRKLGLNLPPQIYSVTQGLNRLQTSLDDTALLIGKTKLLYRALMGDITVSQPNSQATGAGLFEGNLFTDLSYTTINGSRSFEDLLITIDTKLNELDDNAHKTVLSTKIANDAVNGFKNISMFFRKYDTRSSQQRKLLSEFRTFTEQAIKNGFKLEDLDRIKELSAKDPKTLSFEDKTVLERASKFNSYVKNVTEEMTALMRIKVEAIKSVAQNNTDMDRYSTSGVDPKTNEPNDDFSRNTMYLEEVIGEVVYDVKETLGSSKLVSGMGFGGKIKSIVKGAFMQFSDAPGGHVQPEIKL